MKKEISLLILLILSVVMLSACIQKPEAAINGKWECGTETIEFFKDGTVIIDSEKDSMSMGGKYKFVDDDRIRIDLGGLGALAGPIIYKVSISKDELILTDRDGKASKYKRGEIEEKAPIVALIIEVNAEVVLMEGEPSIKIVKVKQDAVDPLNIPRDSSDTGFPGVNAVAIINNSKMSYWPAKDYHGNGTYDLIIGFYQDAVPKEGEMVKVVVKVVNEKGRTLATDMKVMTWK